MEMRDSTGASHMTVSIKNSVIIALVQTGLLVAGILGVAASHKLATKLGYPSRGDYLFFINYAWLLMPVPLIWITVTGWLLTQQRVRETWRTAAFMSGVVIAVLLTTGAAIEVCEPWNTQSTTVTPGVVDS